MAAMPIATTVQTRRVRRRRAQALLPLLPLALVAGCATPAAAFVCGPASRQLPGQALKQAPATARDAGAAVSAMAPMRIAGDDDARGKFGPVAIGAATGAVSLAIAGSSGLAKSLTSVASGILDRGDAGWPGLVEDFFILLMTATTLVVLFYGATIKRRSTSSAGILHAVGGTLSSALALYGVLDERLFREAPGVEWAAAVFAMFALNCAASQPLMDMLRPRAMTVLGLRFGTANQVVLTEMASSFVMTFQGFHLIAWSSVCPALYWLVLPFWLPTWQKMVSTMLTVLSLMQVSPKRAAEEELEPAEAAFAIGNFAASIADVLYLAAFTLRGPEGFWSTAAHDPVLSHVILVRPAAASLAISIVAFLGTLSHRDKVPFEATVALIFVLGFFVPWVFFFWHKLIDPSLPAFPEFASAWHLTDCPLFQVAADMVPGLAWL